MMEYNAKVATIVPKAHLTITAANPLHMALSHCCVDPDYVQFYRDMVTLGHHVILDNSTIETGAPEDFDSYMKAAEAIGPSEIVLPDYFLDGEKTLHSSVAAVSRLRELDRWNTYSIMGIPQGKTVEEWSRCAQSMLEIGVDVIGVSYRYDALFGTRMRLVDQLAEEVDRYGKVIHLLGCNSFRETARGLKMPVVRGVDSAIASVFTKHEILMYPAMDRPPRDIDFLQDRYDEDLLSLNIDRWQRWCHGAY